MLNLDVQGVISHLQ